MRGADDQVTRLPDGRIIGYAQYGDPDGFPIVNAHGGLACRLDVKAAAPVGHALAHRVTRVAIVAGALPLTEPAVYDELPLMDRVLTRMSQRAPWLARRFLARCDSRRCRGKHYGNFTESRRNTAHGPGRGVASCCGLSGR
ncbi:MAG: hypothetical protein ACRDU5_22170 [Mycobacterium sp.]